MKQAGKNQAGNQGDIDDCEQSVPIYEASRRVPRHTGSIHNLSRETGS